MPSCGAALGANHCGLSDQESIPTVSCMIVIVPGAVGRGRLPAPRPFDLPAGGLRVTPIEAER
jgi:hypothetical protein